MTTKQTMRALRLARARAQALAGGVREHTAAGVVRRVFAIQAQDAVAADLGVRVRADGVSAAEVRAAYEDERSIATGWFMRGTLHTVPAEDLRWLLGVFGARNEAANARRYRELDLDEALRERAARVIREAVATHGPLTRGELAERLAAIGVPPSGQAPFHLIRHAALVGVVCHGPRRAGEGTFVLLDDWIPAHGRGPQGDAAAAELALRYARAHGPADAEDFAHWSGLPLSLARRAWAAGPAKTLRPEDAAPDEGEAGDRVDGRGAVGGGDPVGPDVRLLPAYDDYLLAYRDRRLVVPPAHERDVWPGGGVIRPVVLADGVAVGTWGRKGHEVRTAAFDSWGPSLARVIEKESSAVSEFLSGGA
ncbi:winged helix DNA-binding domain-containing protein [Streptodolium elevatio]|uniref:Winged helix DNA-binding domain-containing protein n=1 Tax=Streptodolium elevatio TaxID=3157996 RepID=A0ABV3DIB6_9ACTN